MKIILLSIGKTHKDFIKEGQDLYIKRLKKYINFEYKELPDVKNAGKLQKDLRMQKETEAFLNVIPPAHKVILLDERGKDYSSVKFANQIQNWMNEGHKGLVFVIGGPFGFSPEMYQKAQGKLSLSSMTFSHEMIRLFMTEQIYRAFTILNNEPYHHE